jgi:hypothetical protein
MLERRWGLGRLLFVGTGPTGYLDLLARGGREAEVAEAGARALRRMDSWHVVDLQELRPEAAAWTLFEGWDGPRARAWQSNCTVIEAKPWDELLMRLDRKLRSNVRRALRRAEADGVRRELADADEAGPAARRLVTLSREQWRERWRETGPEHWTPRFEAHLETAARRMTAKGLGGISEFRRGEEAVISHFLIFGWDFVGQYMIGAGQEALQRYQFSSLGIRDAVDIAHDRNISRFSLLRGEEPYKLLWNPRIVPNCRVILGRNTVSWGPYAGYYALRSRVVRYAKSEHAPRWAKDLPASYRVLRYGAARYVKSDRAPRWLRDAAANWFKEI